MVYMFPHWIEAFPWGQAIASSVVKNPFGKEYPYQGTPLELHSDQGTHFTGQVVWQVCAVWRAWWHFHCPYHPQSSGLVEHTNGIIKTQLAKFVEPLQVPWLEALLIILNLRSTPSDTQTLTFLNGHRVPLAPASFDMQLITGGILQYCRGLITSIKINHVLAEQSFQSALQREKELKQQALQPGGFTWWDRHLQKDSLQLPWKGCYGYC